MAPTGWHWPDGYVCVSCGRRGVRHRGRCAGCGTDRPLPGVSAGGEPVCVDCAGIATSFVCAACGEEGELWFAHTCLRCSLRRRAGQVMADTTGEVPLVLRPVHEAIASMTDPWAGLIWLQSAAVRQRLSALATGTVPISHDGLDQLPSGPGREYLRELLMTHRVLPLRDKYLLAFQRWAASRLDTVDALDHRVIRLYLRWRHQRELSARADAGPLPAAAVATARFRINAGIRLLSWLRTRGVTPEGCTQADLDGWYANASNPHAADDFLTWAIRHRHAPPLRLPSRGKSSPTRGSETKRAQLLARLLTDETLDLGIRVAGALVLVLAQSPTRIAKLTLDQIEIRDEEAWIRLGRHPLPLPTPLAHLLVELSAARRNMTTAGQPNSPWLFPGQAPSQHLGAKQLTTRLARVGVRSPSRQAALNTLITQIPAPLLAEALAYHPKTVTSRAGELGTDWASYAASKARSSTSQE
jgi:hypothetical protein